MTRAFPGNRRQLSRSSPLTCGDKSMAGKVGFLFPAFGTGYANAGREPFSGYREEVAELLARGSKIVDLDATRLDASDDDLQAHYVCYVNSCAVSNVLRRRGIRPDCAAPYSMGLFAALFDASSVSFEDGLILTHEVCSLALDSVADGRYGMAAIVGLPRELIVGLIAESFPNLELGDVTNENVLVVSGRCSEMEELLRIAAEKGSLHAKMLPFSLPYHSKFMRDLSGEIAARAARIEIAPPSHEVISCVDQRLLATTEDVREEVASNIGRNMNWFRTMKKMLDLGVDVFVECGASNALTKQAKFLAGDFQVYHPKKFDRLFADNRFASC